MRRPSVRPPMKRRALVVGVLLGGVNSKATRRGVCGGLLVGYRFGGGWGERYVVVEDAGVRHLSWLCL